MYTQFKLSCTMTDVTEEQTDIDQKEVNNQTATPASTLDYPPVEEWESMQSDLRTKVVMEDSEDWSRKFTELPASRKEEALHYIGGIDVSFIKGDNERACAALVVLNFPDFEVIYEDITMVTLTAPYKPGFLAFREVDFFVKKLSRLKDEHPELMPQVVLVDGNGILHPKRLGLASHLGVLVDIATVGVAKDLFQVDGLEKNDDFKKKIAGLAHGGDTFPLETTGKEVLGMALRSSDKTTNPVYVSLGHKISLETAVEITKLCCKFRIPEPTRQADILSREFIRKELGQQ